MSRNSRDLGDPREYNDSRDAQRASESARQHNGGWQTPEGENRYDARWQNMSRDPRGSQSRAPYDPRADARRSVPSRGRASDARADRWDAEDGWGDGWGDARLRAPQAPQTRPVGPRGRKKSKRGPALVLSLSVIAFLLVSLLTLKTLRPSVFAHFSPATATATARSSRHTTTPGKATAAAPAPMSDISSDLAAYLAGQGQGVGAEVYDETHDRYYAYNAHTQFLMGSSAKIPIMLEFFQSIEAQGRGPNGDEQNLLTTMIENSNNDSAQYFYSSLSYDAGLTQFMKNEGIADFTSSPEGFGWSTVSPASMVQLLTLFQHGKVINASDQANAINLMENVESDQQMGVGQTAPQGATVAMKDGWVQGPDGAWAANSSGILTSGNETYIISVYTQEQNDLNGAFDILNHVCADVAGRLA